MKILLINTFIGVSSTGNLTFEIYKNNLKKGDKCVIAYGREDRKKCENKYQISNKFDYSLHAVLTRITDLNGCGSIFTTKRFIKFINEFAPDVIHLHNIHGYYVNMKILFEYIAAKDIPVVWTFHDCWPFTGHCPYYSNINCERWKTGCYQCPKKGQHPASYLLDNSSYNYKMKKKLFHLPRKMVITPVSEWLSKQVRESFLKDVEIETVYNGVDLEIFKPRDSEFRAKYKLENKIILLGVAINWVPTKGLADFVKLSERLPIQYQIVIVGLDESQKNSLPSNILGFGRTENVLQLAEIYSAADIFINPSREETFGMVTAEALACGTPAIVYNATASPELVDNKTGIIVECGDIDAVVSAIDILRSHPLKSEDCVARAEKLFDKKKNQDQYREIYRRLRGEK